MTHLRRITRWLRPVERPWLEREKGRIEAASAGKERCEIIERNGMFALAYTNGCYDYPIFSHGQVEWVPGGGKDPKR